MLFRSPHYLVALLIPAAYVASRGHWWGYAIPLLGWLPAEALGIVAVVGIVAPLVVAPRGDPQLAAETSVVTAPTVPAAGDAGAQERP